MMKRFVDVLVSGAVLVVTAPVLAVIAALVRLFVGSPVLFRQTRPGLGGEPFEILKFRTMTDERDDSGELLPDDDRMSSFGTWLRSTSLDELPEFVNVLRGEMSLVGPRPLLMGYLPLYSIDQARRHEVRPGITGWAQVNGRNALTWEEKFALDVWYVDNHGVLLDFRILLDTLRSVVTREGITASGSATAHPFTGSPESTVR